jgi:hypothetical protein
VRTLVTSLLVLLGCAAPAAAIPFPPGAYKNVDLVNSLSEPGTATAINFMRYDDGREVMLVFGADGLFAFDVTKDPSRPVLLSSLSGEELGGPTGSNGNFFQNEDMDVDRKRKLVFVARDITSNTTATPGVLIIDAADPAALKIITYAPVPQGHTTTCVNECTHLWTTGLLLRREVFVTDVTDPANPVTSPVPVDLGPFDLPAGTSHDVSVDAAGVAWVAGAGYVRGYWTSGSHVDPLTGAAREATPLTPVLYGGGKVPAGDGGPSDQGRFVHGSERPIGPTGDRGAVNYGGFGEGNLIYSAEEAYGDCPVGPFVISSLVGALDTTATGTLENVGVWSPADQEGEGDGECSAHWFTMRDGLVAHGWYGQGTRFIDVRDPRNPIQVGYYRPDETSTSAAYWHGDYVYVADYARGVDILRYTGPGARKPSAPVPAPVPGAPGAPKASGPCAPSVGLANRGQRLARRSVRLRGTGACLPRRARVEVAIARVQAGKCRFVSRRGRLGRAGSCRRPVWQRAKGGERWTFAKRVRLTSGSYTVYVRATGAPERRWRLDARGRATEDVSAPPRRRG